MTVLYETHFQEDHNAIPQHFFLVGLDLVPDKRSCPLAKQETGGQYESDSKQNKNGRGWAYLIYEAIGFLNLSQVLFVDFDEAPLGLNLIFEGLHQYENLIWLEHIKHYQILHFLQNYWRNSRQLDAVIFREGYELNGQEEVHGLPLRSLHDGLTNDLSDKYCRLGLLCLLDVL